MRIFTLATVATILFGGNLFAQSDPKPLAKAAPEARNPKPLEGPSHFGDWPPYPPPPGFEWVRYQGSPWTLSRLSAPGAQGVAPKGGFRDYGVYAGHRCPNSECLYESPARQGTWIQRGTNRDGTHNHECPKCHATWRH